MPHSASRSFLYSSSQAGHKAQFLGTGSRQTAQRFGIARSKKRVKSDEMLILPIEDDEKRTALYRDLGERAVSLVGNAKRKIVR